MAKYVVIGAGPQGSRFCFWIALRSGLTANTKHTILKGVHITKELFIRVLKEMFDKK